MRLMIAVIAALTLTITAQAKTPADLADLIGSKAPGAEAELQARGYSLTGKGNSWWNGKTCVRLHVSQAKVTAITQVKASACGQGSGSHPECPPDLSQADLAQHPGCSL